MPKRAIGFQVLTEIKISAFVFVSRRFSPELNPDGARRAGGRRGYWLQRAAPLPGGAPWAEVRAACAPLYRAAAYSAPRRQLQIIRCD